jgi:hypothetical protein
MVNGTKVILPHEKKIDYKNDGMSNLKFELVETVMFDDNCEMLNVKL